MRFIFVMLIIRISFIDASELSVMSYNVENLFDTKHDLGKEDWTFLPKKLKEKNCERIKHRRYRHECLITDWTEEKLQIKIDQIKRMVYVKGKRPNILALTEVENDQVAHRLQKHLGYTDYLITNSPDRRGVDMMLMYDKNKLLKQITHREYVVDEAPFKEHPTRNILEVEFLVDEKYSLLLYVNHWPSQASPTSSRLAISQKIRGLVEKKLAERRNLYVMLLGDFNTVDKESPSPLENLYRGGLLHSTHLLFLNDKRITQKEKDEMPLGSYYYVKDDVWNMFDQILINDLFLQKKALHINLASYEIIFPEYAQKRIKRKRSRSSVPWRYNFMATQQEKAGYSDHLPIFVKLCF